MHMEISYKDDITGRKAMCDLVRWFGISKSKLIIRGLRGCKKYGDIDSMNFAISFGGVEGEPVRRIISHVLGEQVLTTWIDEPTGSSRKIA